MLNSHTNATRAELERRFPDLHPALDGRSATVEANRCLNCFDAPCMNACPTHIDVPGFIKKVGTGNIAGSARTILDANVLGASCSRVCPVEVLCEGACVMHLRREKPIEIARVQRFAMETFYQQGGRLALRDREERPQKIACIGAGPASLACAAELRQLGFQVTIFEKRSMPGGLNTYGVAEYKLRSPDSLREVDMVRGLGVAFERREIEAEDLEEIEREFDAVFLGVGLGTMRQLNLETSLPEGLQSDTIVDALEFISSYKTGSRLHVPPRVVVVGAGNTAIDAACAATRLGAKTVTVLYRRRRENMSAFDFEYDHAVREGVLFRWSTLPTAMTVHKDGTVELQCVTMQMDGAPEPASEETIECDIVIPAIGQMPLLDLLSQARIAVDGGKVVVDRATGQTTNPMYFAGGDCVNGGREVVDAVADGKRAARGIAEALSKRTEAHLG